MRSSLARWLAVALLALAGPTHAEDPCAGPAPFGAVALGGDDSGIGGTGLGDPDSGIGGTGLGDPDSGIGGTGLGDPDSGIGGTGIFGTVTAFGSVCVNGLRVHYAEDVEVQVNGAPAAAADLSLGQVVYAVAQVHDGQFVTDRIQVWSAAVGAVEPVVGRGMSGDSGRFRVGGLEVTVRRNTRLVGGAPEDLLAGRHVDVSGLPAADGTIVASRIAFVEPDVRAPQRVPTLRQLLSGSGVERVSVESYLSGTRDRPKLAGLELELPERTALRDRVRPGLRVRALGRMVRPGVLRIDRPQRPDRPTPGERPTRPGVGKEVERKPRPIRVDRPKRPKRPERPEILERPEVLDRPQRPERPQRPDILERPEVMERPDRSILP